jgi:hypothetical protein
MRWHIVAEHAFSPWHLLLDLFVGPEGLSGPSIRVNDIDIKISISLMQSTI